MLHLFISGNQPMRDEGTRRGRPRRMWAREINVVDTGGMGVPDDQIGKGNQPGKLQKRLYTTRPQPTC